MKHDNTAHVSKDINIFRFLENARRPTSEISASQQNCQERAGRAGRGLKPSWKAPTIIKQFAELPDGLGLPTHVALCPFALTNDYEMILAAQSRPARRPRPSATASLKKFGLTKSPALAGVSSSNQSVRETSPEMEGTPDTRGMTRRVDQGRTV